MKTRITFLLAILLAGILCQAARAGDTLEEIRKKGFLVAGVRDAAPPFGFPDRGTGEIVGIDVDLARAIAGRLNIALKVKPVTSTGRIPDLLSGQVDLLAAAMIKTPDRTKLVDFSLTYFTTSQRVIARKGAVATLADLEGKRIGTRKGSTAESNVRRLVASAKIASFDSFRHAVDALRKGEVDAVSTYGMILHDYLATLPKGEYEIPKEVRISEEGYGLAVRKGDALLLDFVNATLTGLSADGGMKKIYARWFPPKGSEGAAPPPPKALQAAGVVTRGTATEGRYVVLAIKGTFWPEAAVSIFDPQGHFICKGQVESIYEDEVYIDAVDPPKGVIGSGFAVVMNYSDEEAKKDILAQQDVLRNVKAEAKNEEAQRRKEIARDYRTEKEQRDRYQEEMTKTRMILDYQYSDDYYYWRGYPHNW